MSFHWRKQGLFSNHILQVQEEVAEEFASSVEAIFVETSARANKNVHWLFEELCEYIHVHAVKNS